MVEMSSSCCGMGELVLVSMTNKIGYSKSSLHVMESMLGCLIPVDKVTTCFTIHSCKKWGHDECGVEVHHAVELHQVCYCPWLGTISLGARKYSLSSQTGTCQC